MRVPPGRPSRLLSPDAADDMPRRPGALHDAASTGVEHPRAAALTTAAVSAMSAMLGGNRDQADAVIDRLTPEDQQSLAVAARAIQRLCLVHRTRRATKARDTNLAPASS